MLLHTGVNKLFLSECCEISVFNLFLAILIVILFIAFLSETYKVFAIGKRSSQEAALLSFY